MWCDLKKKVVVDLDCVDCEDIEECPHDISAGKEKQHVCICNGTCKVCKCMSH